MTSLFLKNSRVMAQKKDMYNDVPGQTENALQQKCYFWFWNEYPELRGLLFHVPNGGARDGREAKTFALIGVVAGVSDLILLYKGRAFFIELKNGTGKQSPKQKKWQDAVEAQGFTYFIVNSLLKFKRLIRSLL
jgi:hypothetical protein